MKIGVIGTGTIASAVVRGIAPDGHVITISERSTGRAKILNETFENVSIAANQAVLDRSDVILIGTTGTQADAALTPLTFRSSHIVISLMGDMPLSHVAKLVAPADAQATMIPFPVIATGGSPVLVCPPSPVVTALVGARNMVVDVDDPSQMSPFLAAQATLSPALTLVATATDWLTKRTGDADLAEAFLTTLVANSMKAAPLADTLTALDTPGGYNQRLRVRLEAAYALLLEGLDELEQT
ncbi:NAD(P)-binding domain-containing protein [Aliiroseovarius subalbicans]|uniref:NAD(P)-binding domain-containing protein n=1 Tax=Aliiroseovarius subalbicans TaxID=2925840 RepID=UPI001F58A2D3|nr:NAD(P)-binding domain-containing protein [Aliiroseovarius subalbicans]MCI2399919.1 NAD(P)-binding domain-containing protein [Aliiroseovarius subalbicans]